MAGMGAHPPKSATGVSKMLSSKCPSHYHTKLEELKFKMGINFICKVRKQARNTIDNVRDLQIYSTSILV